MSKIIYKYQVELAPEFSLSLKENFSILCLQVQNDVPYLWIEVSPAADQMTVEFSLRVTGKQFDQGDDETYVGSFLLNEGAFVGHLYHN